MGISMGVYVYGKMYACSLCIRPFLPQGRKGQREESKTKESPSLATNMTWAGKNNAKVNNLTGKNTFDPCVPIQPGEQWDDSLIWADVPSEVERKRLEQKSKLITEDCLKVNVKAFTRTISCNTSSNNNCVFE